MALSSGHCTAALMNHLSSGNAPRQMPDTRSATTASKLGRQLTRPRHKLKHSIHAGTELLTMM
jgi:hypothetical protein